MDETELKHRTKQFALRCMRLADSLPKTRAGNVIANQLTRCGTSVGANYRAACRGRSQADFLAKLGVVEEETDEAGFWMELIVESGMKTPSVVQPLHDEADQLVRIIIASIKTMRRAIQNPKSKIQSPP